MDLKKVIHEYEFLRARKEREEDDRRTALEAERERERIRREGNAEALQRHLRSVVEPVFREAERQMAAIGSSFIVEETGSKHPDFESSKMFMLRLVLRQNDERSAYLEFEGDYEILSITPTQRIAGRAVKETPLTMAAVNAPYVEARTEGFIRAALGLA